MTMITHVHEYDYEQPECCHCHEPITRGQPVLFPTTWSHRDAPANSWSVICGTPMGLPMADDGITLAAPTIIHIGPEDIRRNAESAPRVEGWADDVTPG